MYLCMYSSRSESVEARCLEVLFDYKRYVLTNLFFFSGGYGRVLYDVVNREEWTTLIGLCVHVAASDLIAIKTTSCCEPPAYSISLVLSS